MLFYFWGLNKAHTQQPSDLVEPIAHLHLHCVILVRISILWSFYVDV